VPEVLLAWAVADTISQYRGQLPPHATLAAVAKWVIDFTRCKIGPPDIIDAGLGGPQERERSLRSLLVRGMHLVAHENVAGVACRPGPSPRS